MQRRANGTMHIILNGEDLGAAAQGITEVFVCADSGRCKGICC